MITKNQELLLGAIIGLLRTINGDAENMKAASYTLSKAYLALLSGDDLLKLVDDLHVLKELYAPECKYCSNPCGRTEDFDFRAIMNPELTINKISNLFWHIGNDFNIIKLNNLAFNIGEETF